MAKQLSRKDLLKISSNLMKEEKKKNKNYKKSAKFKFNWKKNLYKSLFIVLAFAMLTTLMIPFTTENVDATLKIIAWTLYSTAFVCIYLFFLIYMYLKERDEFLRNDPLYLQELQAHVRYEKEIKKQKVQCKLNHVKFTKKMREDIQLEVYSIKVDKKAEPKTLEEEYITKETTKRLEASINKKPVTSTLTNSVIVDKTNNGDLLKQLNVSQETSVNLETTYAPTSFFANEQRKMFPSIKQSELEKIEKKGIIRHYRVDENGNEVDDDEKGKETKSDEKEEGKPAK